MIRGCRRRVRVASADRSSDEQRPLALFARLGRYGRVLAVVDRPASIGALPVAVARAGGCQVAYLPGLTMRRPAVHPGNAETDARHVIAARAFPHTLRGVGTGDETLAGFDDDLTGEADRRASRIRGLTVTSHPALEKAPGPRLHHRARVRIPVRPREQGVLRSIHVVNDSDPADGTPSTHYDITTSQDVASTTSPET